MAQQNPEESKELGGILKRVNQLGSTTERLFSRLYRGLNQRSNMPSDQTLLSQQEQLLDMKLTQAQKFRDENRSLKRELARTGSEVERLHNILAGIDEGIITQDMDGRITMFNEAAKKLLGGQKNFWESELGNIATDYQQVDTLQSELVPLGEIEELQINNRILWAQLAAIGDQHGSRIGTLIILRDVTSDTLAERLKDSFVTHISHELKTPMTVIKLASEVLAGQPEDEPANRRMLEALSRNVDVLDRLVVELLEISEMSAGSFEIRHDPVPIEPILGEVVENLTAEMQDAEVYLTLRTRNLADVEILGDDKRLTWALEHLVRNATAYNLKNGKVSIQAIVATIEEKPYVLIQVSDNGVGISEKDLPHIFERFYRGEPRTAEGKRLDPRGLGQGLFIAKTISEAHGGYLTVQSKVGEGTEFTMALPLQQEPALTE